MTAQRYNPETIPDDRVVCRSFDALPRHDTLWDMCLTPDDTAYFGVCVEFTGGMSAWLCSYRRDTDRIEYLADMAEVTGEPNDSGHATQGKIHFSLCAAADGAVYGATHCTTAPQGETVWNPFTMYADPVRCYPGGHLFRYDPRARQTADLGILIPHEGVRVMVMDAERKILHGTTYPKCHYFVYDLNKRRLTDLGRFGAIHQLALFIDRQGNGYTTDNFGRLVRCEAGSWRLRTLDAQIPHAPFRRGENNILLTTARDPATDLWYGITYSVERRLFCFDPATGRMRDLGMGYGMQDDPCGLELVYPGGLTVGRDGLLYYTLTETVTDPDNKRGHLIRHDPARNEAVDFGVVAPQGRVFSGHSCHGKTDSAGVMYFTQNSAKPPRFYMYLPQGAR
jgi:hypothetical protein